MAKTPLSADSLCTSTDESDASFQTLPHDRIIVGRTVSLVPVEILHIDGLWRQLSDATNKKLLWDVYGVIPTSKTHIWGIISYHLESHPDGAAWTVLDKTAREILGWAAVQPRAEDSTTVECAIFLLQLPRSEQRMDAWFYFSVLLFNDLEFETVEVRAGKLDASSNLSRAGGITLIGVLARQLRDEGRSIDSDIYVLRRAKWPNVYAAVKAWLDAKDVCMGISTNTHSALDWSGILEGAAREWTAPADERWRDYVRDPGSNSMSQPGNACPGDRAYVYLLCVCSSPVDWHDDRGR